MSPLIRPIFTALTQKRQTVWPALGIHGWFKPLEILAIDSCRARISRSPSTLMLAMCFQHRHPSVVMPPS